MLKRLFQRHRTSLPEAPSIQGEPAQLPAGVRLYAVGDIHGRFDLLVELEHQILKDAEGSGSGLDLHLVYLGDYVDRGPDSRRVLEHLAAAPLSDFTVTHLLGNHDVWLREFARGTDCGPSWVRFGGDATLVSYGVQLDPVSSERERFVAAQADLRAKLPRDHLAFLDGLELGFGFGDYFFCHAGIRPDVPLERQSEVDLLMIREPFLSWTGDCGKVVVHGHTVDEHPIVRANRIGIDTGACWTNNLTCLVLEGADYRFLSTVRGQSD